MLIVDLTYRLVLIFNSVNLLLTIVIVYSFKNNGSFKTKSLNWAGKIDDFN